MIRSGGAQNFADMFTKPLTNDMISSLCHDMGLTFPDGKDGIALTIHGLECHLTSADQMQKMINKFGLEGKHEVWTRTDLNAKTYKTSAKGGPEWSSVQYRISVDNSTRQVIAVEDVFGMPREDEHRHLEQGRCDLLTILLYNPRGSTAVRRPPIKQRQRTTHIHQKTLT